MAYVKFYLDRPFSADISKEELQLILKKHSNSGKPYPKSILNTRTTSIYLFFNYEKGSRLKMKTSLKTLAENWDFKVGKYRGSVRGSLELNNELNDLGLKVLKAFSKLKEEKKFIEKDDLKTLLDNCIVGEKILSNAVLENAA